MLENSALLRGSEALQQKSSCPAAYLGIGPKHSAGRIGCLFCGAEAGQCPQVEISNGRQPRRKEMQATSTKGKGNDPSVTPSRSNQGTHQASVDLRERNSFLQSGTGGRAAGVRWRQPSRRDALQYKTTTGGARPRCLPHCTCMCASRSCNELKDIPQAVMGHGCRRIPVDNMGQAEPALTMLTRGCEPAGADAISPECSLM